MTNLETVVYEKAKEITKTEYCTDVKELASETNLEVSTVKGVVGSLVKKGLMVAEEDDRDNMKWFDLFPIVDGELWSFASENLGV